MSEIIDHIVGSVTPASSAQSAAMRRRLQRSAGAGDLGALAELAARLAAARHSPHPSVERVAAVVVAADHGVALPGVDLGDHHPTIVAVEEIACGRAAINSAARAADVSLVVIDAGIRGAAGRDWPAGVLAFRHGNATGDITAGPAMSGEEAQASLQTGIALLFSLADAGLDLVALGQVAPGSQPVSAAVVAALTGIEPARFGRDDTDAVRAALRQNPASADQPGRVLAGVGGYDIGMLAGIILAAASINVPVILDDHGTAAAAVLAAALAPASRGYLFASHQGTVPAHRIALQALGLEPMFALGLSHGEGTGAILAAPMLAAAARVAREAS